MVSTQFLTGVLALLAANAVSAGPCKPSSSTVDTTTTVEATTAETSSATVSDLFIESLTSLGSTETANSLSTLGTSTTLLTTTTEEPTSSAATSATTSAASSVECTTNAECNALHGGSAPFCSSAGNCIGCRGDGDCYGETPYCDDNFCNDVVGHGGFKMRR
ncbi:uncharacterized protein FSUBG_2360 [Fusarium subglutinans]|uniref:Uncharacterized protein n=1 Tax=Gibberella subglutinans TaxID=42677 RepID=A0A8H5V748_GIBSU|nr:uncharacterized protein FSUBG_2360 [Fusarium subglutinans]KAF5611255.1 hypothetical protein FSUBG_2360 [Fusarium subglutinans]